MKARQAVLTAPHAVAVREVELPDPAPNQILVRTEASVVSAGTELAVYTGTHQWLKDPNLPDWKFPFRPGYSAAGVVAAVGSDVTGWKPGDRVSYPGNHASAELLTHRPRARQVVAAAGRPRRREGRLGLRRPLRPRRLHPRRHHARPLRRRARPRRHRPVRPALPHRGRRPSGRRHRRRRHAPPGRDSPPAPITSSTPRPATSASSWRRSSSSAAPRSWPTPPAFPTRCRSPCRWPATAARSSSSAARAARPRTSTSTTICIVAISR